MADSTSPKSLRVLVLSKRQYMSRDLLDDRYGRFRELPLALSSLGVEVRGLCLSYRSRSEISVTDENDTGRVAWTSRNLWRVLPFGNSSYWRTVDQIGKEFHPEVVWACSDVPHAALGAAVAKRLGAKLVIDLYDNFESYPLARVPGANYVLRQAIQAADGVTCISSPLLKKVRNDYNYSGKLAIIENAIPTGVFVQQDKATARTCFGLPQLGIFIGTAGALSRGRGTEVLFEAFLKLATERDDVHLVLAGPMDKNISAPNHERVHYLGLLPADRVPLMLAALDISVIGNIDSPFGRYCFPQKLYESLSVGLPVAVARVGAMAELLSDWPDNLYDPSDVESLTNRLRCLCHEPRTPRLDIPTWDLLGISLFSFLSSCRS